MPNWPRRLAVLIAFMLLPACGVEITAPPDGARFRQGEQIVLRAQLVGVSDVRWRSSLDGTLGDERVLHVPEQLQPPRPLSIGSHTIVAESPGLFIWSTYRDEIALRVGGVDQANLVATRTLAADDGQSPGQTFAVDRRGLLLGIELAVVRCRAADTDLLTLVVGRGSQILGSVAIPGGNLPGPGLCGAAPAPLDPVAHGPAYFDLGSLNQSVAPRQTYFFFLKNALRDGFYVGIGPNVYPSGTALLNGDVSTDDLAFKIWVAP